MKTIKIKLNRDIGGHKADQIVSVPADQKGAPLDRWWRARLKDSELDNCCEIVKNKRKASAKSKPQKEPKE